MHQKVAFSNQPAFAIRRQGKGWHQIVDVGVVAQVARPGLQDAQHAHLPTQEARVLSQLLERGRGRTKEQRVDRLGLLSSERAELRRQCKGDQEVGNRQQQRLLLGEPGLGSVLLTRWAVAVATGMVAVAGDLARRAGVDVATKGLGTTLGDRLQRLKQALGQRAAKARAIGRPVAAEDLTKGGHRRPAASVSSTPLASSSAFWVRWVEIAVVVGERWPSQSWMMQRLTPAASRCVA